MAFELLVDALKNISGSVAQDGMWDESKHPRKGGKFAKKGDGETFSNRDAVAVHEATAKANWEMMHPKHTDTPASELAKNHQKLNTLLKVGKVVNPGANIKASGIGQLHMGEFARADRMDERPKYGPNGAKREDRGSTAHTHPFHQGVIEAFQSIQNEADRIGNGSAGKAHAPSEYAKTMYAKQKSLPGHGTNVVSSSSGRPLREVHSPSVREVQWGVKAREKYGNSASVPISRRTGLVSHPSDRNRVSGKYLKAINGNLPK